MFCENETLWHVSPDWTVYVLPEQPVAVAVEIAVVEALIIAKSTVKHAFGSTKAPAQKKKKKINQVLTCGTNSSWSLAEW